MDHADHVALIQGGVVKSGGVWADLGSGTGAFTLALRDVTGPAGHIYSVDRNRQALEQQHIYFDRQFPQTRIEYLTADFTSSLDLPPLDGIIMANSLHFIPSSQQTHLVRHLRAYLKPAGQLVLVEYNTDHGNQWVPYPLSFTTFAAITKRAGFDAARLLSTIPSAFLDEIYSAVAANTSLTQYHQSPG